MAEKRVIELEVQSNLNESTESIKSLRAQLKEMKAQLASLDEGSEEFKKIARAAGELQDKIGDVNQRVKNFASDTRKLDVALEGVSAASGAFEAFEGSMALVGIESEDLQKTMVKLQAVMAVTNGIQSVANALNKDSALTQALSTVSTKAATIAQSIYTIVVGTSTGALKAFRIALATTGIGAFVVVLGFAVEAMGLLGGKTKDEEKAQKLLEKQTKQLEKSIQDYNDSTNNLIQTIDNATRSELALARQRGASQAELTKITKAGVQSRLDAQNRETEELKKIYLQQSKTGTTENYEKARKAYLDAAQKTSDLRIQIQEIDADIAEEQRQSFQQTVSTASGAAQEIVSLANEIKDEQIKQIEDQKTQRIAQAVEEAKRRKDELKKTVANAKEKATLLKLIEDNLLIDIGKITDEFSQIEYDKEKERLQKIEDLKIDAAKKERKRQEDLLIEAEGFTEERTRLTMTEQEIEERNLNDWYFEKVNLFQGNAQALEDLEILFLNRKNDINKKYQDAADKTAEEIAAKQKERDKKEFERKKQLYFAQAQMASDALNLVASIMESNSKGDLKRQKQAFNFRKAANIAQASIDGTKAVLSTFADTPGGIVMKSIAATIAGGFAALKIAQIAKSKFEAPSLGGNDSPSGGGGGGSMTANFNTIGTSGINQLATLQQQPVQAFVVSGEVTSAQSLDRNRIQNATL